jgi:hypothetical protein
MEGRCDKHLFEKSVDVCRECGYEFCPECLIYAFGPKQPPYCVPCAVSAAGIRRNAGPTPSMSKAAKKQLLKERKAYLATSAKEAKAAAKAARRNGGSVPADAAVAARAESHASGPVPSPSALWSPPPGADAAPIVTPVPSAEPVAVAAADLGAPDDSGYDWASGDVEPHHAVG